MSEPDTVPEALDRDRVPTHVAWALGAADRAAGGVGTAALVDVVDGALAIGIRWLTVYVLAATDLPGADGRQPGPEGPSLSGVQMAGVEMAGVEGFLADQVDRLADLGVRLRVSGHRSPAVPDRLAGLLDEAVGRTSAGDRLTLTLAVGYDGRAEIVDAVAALARSGVGPDEVDEAAIAAHLYHPDMPDPDLVVRPSGDRRVSDLLLWEVAYSELVFVDRSWADVRRHDLYQAVIEYQRRDRRYGGLDPAGPR